MLRKAIRRITLLLLSSSLITLSCGKNETAKMNNGKLKTVSTINIINDIVKNIGGDKIEAVSICGVGVDPHTYHPKPSDPRLVSESEVVFINGLGLEHWMEEMIRSAGGNKKVVTVSEGITPMTDEKGFGDPDPHAWFNVEFVKTYAKNAAKGLSEADPNNAKYYADNLTSYIAKLDSLHNWAKQQIASISSEQKVLVTSHDAFRYFGKEYGLEVKGLQGISTESKVRTEDVKSLIDLIKQRNLKAVFVETSVNPKLLEQISSETGARIGGQLFSDSIGNEGTPEGSYTGAFAHNVNTIVNALK
jgi:ABC-type Zn uptake system ZnuABC Zn-binding protein ZnuA